MTGRAGKEKALDEFLVASARVGDRKALELLAQRWHAKLRAHAWRLLGDSEQASDAAQDSWREIIRSLDRLRDEAVFPAWAYRIVSRRCAKLITNAQRQRQLRDTLAAEPEPEPAPSANGTDANDLERLRAAVRALPPEQRAAIALFYSEGLSAPKPPLLWTSPRAR
jgi:RNA polymerase sigma factor (sigma-70 family)